MSIPNADGDIRFPDEQTFTDIPDDERSTEAASSRLAGGGRCGP
jgi:hypothetical protein